MTTFDDHVAARTIYGEARGESDEGKLAVAHVIRNRLAKPTRWGKTAASVCLSAMQFSCWNVNDPNRRLLLELGELDLTLAKCFYAWSSALLTDDPTEGSTHYKVVGTYARWADGATPVATIGAHEFFRGIL